MKNIWFVWFSCVPTVLRIHICYLGVAIVSSWVRKTIVYVYKLCKKKNGAPIVFVFNMRKSLPSKLQCVKIMKNTNAPFFLQGGFTMMMDGIPVTCQFKYLYWGYKHYFNKWNSNVDSPKYLFSVYAESVKQNLRAEAPVGSSWQPAIRQRVINGNSKKIKTLAHFVPWINQISEAARIRLAFGSNGVEL